MKISYTWLQTYFKEPLPTPEQLADILTFKLCEVEGIEKLQNGDTVLDLNILPNRAHDLLSHRGIAREVAGLLGYKTVETIYEKTEGVVTDLKINIETNKCRRYAGRIIRGVKIGSSPDWLKTRLEGIGSRSINNIVDATNYVLFDLGQPTHAFDLSKISDATLSITVAQEGQELPVLSRENIVAKLKETDLVIASNETLLALAGIKGGLSSGVTDATTDIVLEVANFDPVAIRKTARRLGLLSDAAKRFENDLSPALVDEAMNALTKLIVELAGGTPELVVDSYIPPTENKKITFRPSWINNLLGTNLTDEEMITLLKSYGYEVEGDLGNHFLLIPTLRLDLTHEYDIAEEVARLYGLDKIQATPVSIPRKPAANTIFATMTAARTKLVTDGYRETITYAFRKKGVVEVARGVGDKSALRTNLTDGLKESYELNRLNAPLLGLSDIKLFEIGNVFTKEGETLHVAWIDKKGVTEMTLDEYAAKENMTAGAYALPDTSKETTKFKPWSVYPFIVRDIAVWVPETVTPTQLMDFYVRLGTDILVRIDLFDHFTKDGRNSYAFRLVFQSETRTLTIEEVDTIISSIHKEIISSGWEVR
jgi:phenylalanyl-tRNA synthetase beta subunit